MNFNRDKAYDKKPFEKSLLFIFYKLSSRHEKKKSRAFGTLFKKKSSEKKVDAYAWLVES